MRLLSGLLIIFSCCFLVLSPVSAYDFTLSVYGNANMDDIIDEADIAFLERIIAGTEEKTPFADANYDGVINEDDIDRIYSILSGEETEVTLIDTDERTVTLKIPIERAIAAYPGASTLATDLGITDQIVGVDSSSLNNAKGLLLTQVFPGIENLPDVGFNNDFNQEMIISLKPDVILAGNFFLSPDTADSILDNTGVPVIYPGYFNKVYKYDDDGGIFETWRQMGILFRKEARVEELIAFWEEKLSEIREVVSDFPEEDKSKIYIAGFPTLEGTLVHYDPICLAGGKNLADDLPPNKNGVFTLSKEQIIEWNPDIIIVHRGASEKPSILIDDILKDPTLQSVNAIQKGQVYYLRMGMAGRIPAGELAESFYLAKLLYPDNFSQINVESEGNEIFAEFYDVDNLYSWIQDYCGLYSWE